MLSLRCTPSLRDLIVYSQLFIGPRAGSVFAYASEGLRFSGSTSASWA